VLTPGCESTFMIFEAPRAATRSRTPRQAAHSQRALPVDASYARARTGIRANMHGHPRKHAPIIRGGAVTVHQTQISEECCEQNIEPR
jgi:hypothetical protein